MSSLGSQARTLAEPVQASNSYQVSSAVVDANSISCLLRLAQATAKSAIRTRTRQEHKRKQLAQQRDPHDIHASDPNSSGSPPQDAVSGSGRQDKAVSPFSAAATSAFASPRQAPVGGPQGQRNPPQDPQRLASVEDTQRSGSLPL